MSFIHSLIVGTDMLFTDKAATSMNGAGSMTTKTVKHTMGLVQATNCSLLYIQAGSYLIFLPHGLYLILTKASHLLS